jgi:hypothetical protein
MRNGTAGEWTRMNRDAWTLQEDLRIGRLEGDGPDVFGRISEVIPGIDGTIWVLDSQARQLEQFDSDGAPLRTLGRPGEGPGELGAYPCAFASPEGEIWVESGRRWQRWSARGELLGTQLVTRSLGCGILAWRGDELAAALARYDPATQEFSSALILHERSPDGSVIVRDTVPMPTIPDGPTVEWTEAGRVMSRLRLPLAHSPGYFLQRSGVFWVTDGGGLYRFRRQTLEGDTLLIVERAYGLVAVPDSIRAAEIEGLNRGDRGYPDDFTPSDVPRVFPPFERIIEAEDGTLWLRRRIEGGQSAYDVFSANGEYLGPVLLPSGLQDFSERAITEDHVYGVARGQLDVHYAVRLRIHK